MSETIMKIGVCMMLAGFTLAVFGLTVMVVAHIISEIW